MAETQRRFMDVWIVESNTVYREVPFTVVCDWIQQGRLLESDMLRPSGTAQWFKIGGMPTFAAYLPKVEPFRVEDQAEAMEPVHGGFSWRRRHDEEDDDIDMIPLIDVSLVLLIFFMMTGSAVTAAGLVSLPKAEYGQVTSNRELWVGINSDEKGNPKAYLVGSEDSKIGEYKVEGNEQEALNKLLATLDEELAKRSSPVEITILANGNLKSGKVRNVLVELERKERKAKVRLKHTGVSEKRQ